MKSDEWKYVQRLHVQFYGYGEGLSSSSIQKLTDAGYDLTKVVLGMISSDGDTEQNLQVISSAFKNTPAPCGVAIWEWKNSSSGPDQSTWARDMRAAMGGTSAPQILDARGNSALAQGASTICAYYQTFNGL